ncbi:MAG: hypothetical protein J1F25_05805 [Prevotellaceae bacterium]|nr:hypothetical protein [Prevotellaceae bacterium]
MNLDDELLQDAEDSVQAVAFIRNYLPQELKEKFTDDDLYYMLDVLLECYTETDVLDVEPDADGYADIDLERIVDYVVRKAKKEQMGPYEPDDVLLVVQAEMDYSEQVAEED